MELSILIVNWNTRQYLERCLASLPPALSDIEAEVIIVDNGSTDGSAVFVREHYPSFRLITNDRNRGFAEANNQAFRLATGECLLLLNNDAILSPGDLKTLLAPLRADPALGGTIPTLLNADGSTQYGYHRRRATGLRLIGAFLHNGKLWRNNPWARQYLMLDDDLQHEQVIEEPAAACLLLRRQAIKQNGRLFDAARFPIHFNDAALAEDLARLHWHTQLVPAVRVVHAGGTTVNRVDPYALKQAYLVSLILFTRQYRPFAEYLLVKLLLAVISVVFLLFTSFGIMHWYFTTPITDRRASVRAQRRVLKALFAERHDGW